MTKVFILGAPDPEMEEIERVLRANKCEVRYAMLRNRRVRAEYANTADAISDGALPAEREIVFVECRVMGLSPAYILDHHQPGDPGYEGTPAQYLESSSLGQVLAHLGLEATEEQRLIAAADHCPSQAYRGECPGIDVQALARWRTASRAQRRGISEEEMERLIEEAKVMLETAEHIPFCGTLLPWLDSRKGEVTEASARYNIPFMYRDVTKEGKQKAGIMGAPAHVISAWMKECGLPRVYGNPHRGYAGGYC